MTALRPIKLKIRRAPREERCKILVKTFGFRTNIVCLTGYLLIKA